MACDFYDSCVYGEGEIIKMKNNGWSTKPPKKPGVYWFYSYRYGKVSCGRECEPELMLLTVSKISNGVLMKKVFITTDCQFCPAQIHDFYNMADLIFHDCEVGFRSGVHPNYDDLMTLPKETKKKIWLYHTDGVLPDAKKDGFLGFVEKGQVFE